MAMLHKYFMVSTRDNVENLNTPSKGIIFNSIDDIKVFDNEPTFLDCINVFSSLDVDSSFFFVFNSKIVDNLEVVPDYTKLVKMFYMDDECLSF